VEFAAPPRAAGGCGCDNWDVALPPKRVVQQGYDRIADSYAQAVPDPDGPKAKYIGVLRDLVPAGARVLDLGCGTGAHVTRDLAEDFDVVGVDISARSIARASETVGRAAFLVGDMATVAFAPGSFNAVVAFFSLIHVPRVEHALVLRSLHNWLRPGGVCIVTMGAGAGGEDTGTFHGAEMYWSSWPAAESLRLVENAGFELLSATDEHEDENGIPVTHLWVVARRP
jgi:SAM-dependent methyltransferase